jgi:hypothetical protein
MEKAMQDAEKANQVREGLAVPLTVESDKYFKAMDEKTSWWEKWWWDLVIIAGAAGLAGALGKGMSDNLPPECKKNSSKPPREKSNTPLTGARAWESWTRSIGLLPEEIILTDKAPPLERPDVAGLQEGGVAQDRHRPDAGVSDRPHGGLQRPSITEYTEYSINAMRSARQGRNNDGRCGVARDRHRPDAGVSDRPHGVLQRPSITEYTEYSINAMRSARQGRNNEGR